MGREIERKFLVDTGLLSLSGGCRLVQGYLPDAQISFENETGGRKLSGNYMMDNTRMVQEFEYDLAPYPQRVLEIINAVRAAVTGQYFALAKMSQ